MAQAIPASLGKCDGGDLGRLLRQQCHKPGPMLGAVDLGITDHGECAGGEQVAQMAIALLADAAELVLALLGSSSIQADKFRVRWSIRQLC